MLDYRDFEDRLSDALQLRQGPISISSGRLHRPQYLSFKGSAPAPSYPSTTRRDAVSRPVSNTRQRIIGEAYDGPSHS